MPASAAFPSGLPEGLNGSAGVPPMSEGSDSEYGSEHTLACNCKVTGICNCAVPRVPTSAAKRKGRMHTPEEASSSSNREPPMNQPAALVATANSGKNRPVLPRPTAATHPRASPPRSHPSTSYQQHRSHTLFSPYERAYEYTHGADLPAGLTPFDRPSNPPFPLSSVVGSSAPHPRNEFPPQDATPDDLYASMSSWLATVQPAVELPPLSCECGPTCACPGCYIHQGSSATRAGMDACANPSSCMFCFNCTLLAATQDNITGDEWLRNSNFPDVSSSGNSEIGSGPPFYMPSPGQSNQHPSSFDPSMWQTYALWNNLSSQPGAPTPPEDAEATCCNGQCKCPPGMCMCPSDCCGCCAGCACPSCEHDDRSMGTGKTLTFAVSGERGPCCSGSRSRSADPGVGNPGSSSRHGTSATSAGQETSQYADSTSGQDFQSVYDEWSGLSSALTVPRVALSRASSSSSRSSSQHSHHSSAHEHGPSPGVHVHAADSAAIRSCCRGLQSMGTSSSPASQTSGSVSPIPPPPPFTPPSDRFSPPQHIPEDANARIF